MTRQLITFRPNQWILNWVLSAIYHGTVQRKISRPFRQWLIFRVLPIILVKSNTQIRRDREKDDSFIDLKNSQTTTKFSIIKNYQQAVGVSFSKNCIYSNFNSNVRHFVNLISIAIASSNASIFNTQMTNIIKLNFEIRFIDI